MKRIRNASVILVLCLLAFCCQNEPVDFTFPELDNPEEPIPPTGDFIVDFDNETYIADAANATISNDAITISGIRGLNGEEISIALAQNNGVGTYQLGLNNGVALNEAIYNEGNNNGLWVTTPNGTQSQGQVLISEIDNVNEEISGTFSFIGTNAATTQPKPFTNGAFTNIPYIEADNDNNNTFFARVDGVEFVEDTVDATFLDINGATTIRIKAVKTNQEGITITMDGNIMPGNYNINTFSLPNAQYNLSATDINAGTGSLTITTHDFENKNLIGTFQFQATSITDGIDQTFSITEGAFNVTYY